MSATDELRRMLDERGVEWDYGITGSTTTMFSVNGIDITFTPLRDGLVCSTILTPEQAVTATLGAGTCKVDETETWQGVCMMSKPIRYVRNLTIHVMECSACGGTYEHVNGGYEFCPRCGRKVVTNG